MKLLLDEMWSPAVIGVWPRANPGVVGRLVEMLDALLTANDAIEGKHWLN